MITKKRVSKNVGEHMVDIVDSIYVQVAWSKPRLAGKMIKRAKYLCEMSTLAENYLDKEFYVLAEASIYANYFSSDCRLSFFPSHRYLQDQ